MMIAGKRIKELSFVLEKYNVEITRGGEEGKMTSKDIFHQGSGGDYEACHNPE